jgi:hypothetical protein
VVTIQIHHISRSVTFSTPNSFQISIDEMATPSNDVVGSTQEQPQQVIDKYSYGIAQQTLNDFWEGYVSKHPGKVLQIFSKSLYTQLLPPSLPAGNPSRSAIESYEAAVVACVEQVKQAVRDCQRTNEKFTDPDFNLKSNQYGCRNGLYIETAPTTEATSSGSGIDPATVGSCLITLGNMVKTQELDPNVAAKVYQGLQGIGASTQAPSGPSVHRVDYIFENPEFVIDGYSSSDVQQGSIGDCWWLAAVANVCGVPGLMDRLCVARDVECGVYGFVFHRDGEWISTIVDDNLLLRYIFGVLIECVNSDTIQIA